ncbi:MAG: D-aminoacylase [Acidobacteriales bacterium]|nr:D-aminoacylase [Terriglobales bacterium]
MRILLSLLLLASPLFSQSPTYDLLIRNGRVVDGSGNPWVYADIGITADRIVFLGKVDKDVTVRRVIDAKGLVVAPGFIDMLGQSETSVLIDKQAMSKITQGITTEITGEGGSIAPLNQRLIDEAKPWTDHYRLTLDWTSLDDYFRRLAKQGSAVNMATYVGATQIRQVVIGDDDRAPTPEELKVMEQMVSDAMDDGALGLSTSLIYAPAFYAKTDELIALARVAGLRGGAYATHMRNESDRIWQALDEAIRIGREARIPVEIFHIKMAGKQNWGKMRDVVAKIERARAEGLDITADQYPYLAGATSLGASVPPKYHDGGTEKFLARLADPAQRVAMQADLEKTGDTDFEKLWRGSGGGDGVLILSVLQPELKQYEGKTMTQAAAMMGKDVYSALFDLLIASKDNIGAAYFLMNEDDMRYALQQPWVGVGTDHGAVSTTGPLAEGRAHPRGYGSFPRILGKYVREEKVLRLEEAIRKMTSLAAQRVKLENRGLLRQDYFADITIFDPDTVIDVATFEDPNRPSKGIEYVIVNGVLEIAAGKITGDVGGRPLRGPGWINRGVTPDGMRPKGKLQGVVSTEDGWALPRTKVTLYDAAGKQLAEVTNKRDGRYEMIWESPCKGCRIIATRLGFKTVEKKVDYNGANPLWFNFTLPPVPKAKKQ